MPDDFLIHPLANGMTVLAEKMPGVRSAAMNLLVPAGVANDPVERCGGATVLAEMALRGAGGRDARQLTDALDDLGLSRGSGPGTHHTRFTAAALSENVMKGLPLHADVVRRPTLGDDVFGPSRDLALQALAGLPDNPQSLAMIKLREWHWPAPFSRNVMGEETHLRKMTAAGVRDDFASRYVPDGAILSVAGDVDFDELTAAAEELFGDWQSAEPPEIEVTPPPGNRRFIELDSQQTHLALAYPTSGETADDYYPARLAVEVLSGGMSGRLFGEIREKKGLCYSVYASYSSLPNLGGVFCYAGTSNERAQATLDAFLHELTRLREGVTADELDRAKIGLKAGTVMSGESSSARSGALARDWFIRGRLRTLDEIVEAVDGVTLGALNGWLADHPAGPFTVVQIGPKQLEVPD